MACRNKRSIVYPQRVQKTNTNHILILDYPNNDPLVTSIFSPDQVWSSGYQSLQPGPNLTWEGLSSESYNLTHGIKRN